MVFHLSCQKRHNFIENWEIFVNLNTFHYVMENGENQHTFIRCSVSQQETQFGKVRQSQMNLMNSVFDSVSRFVTVFDAERINV